MVAKITTTHSIVRALNYNEKKLRKGEAECIHAGNILQDAKVSNFCDKLNTFKNLMELNTSGSDIGKSYSAASIQERIGKGLIQNETLIAKLLRKHSSVTNLLKKERPVKRDREYQNSMDQKNRSQLKSAISKTNDTLEILIKRERNDNRLPYELLRKKKRKRKLNL